MLAAIPSVVFGLWGIFVVIPFIRPAADWLHERLGFIPLFGTSLSGPGMLPAVIVLCDHDPADGRRDLPGRDRPRALQDQGSGLRHGHDALGSHPESYRPDGRLAASPARLCLGFGRALGETMALAMLIGNANQISLSLFSPANTLASLARLELPRGRRRSNARR